ncbi:MAG TPA: type II toxin-antitoxin system YafQ family toxin [Leucothrix mucor]|uniref:Type II toxin-antitoxin system YafQ family toxin n=1 Tax=Leucothrix mucor TaxID=45248 RepID=A0A7V2T2B2_LEUMU|nr:type II toxin-antitoxin system YafQ family toxin [Leucothrix mucor]
MLDIVYSSQFKRDFKKAKKLPFEDLKQLFDVISVLEKNKTLDQKYKDHLLTGNWNQFRECHLKADWLLIYQIQNNELQLARLGSHSELF